jgi:hypothetical protein
MTDKELYFCLFGFVRFLDWFFVFYPDYIIRPLRLNQNCLESLFAALKSMGRDNTKFSLFDHQCHLRQINYLHELSVAPLSSNNPNEPNNIVSVPLKRKQQKKKSKLQFLP